MEATEAPTDEPIEPSASGVTAATVIEVVGIVSLAITLVLDVTSRFILRDQTLFRFSNAAAIVAAVCAVLDAAITAQAYRRHPHAFRLHLAADIAAAALLVVSVVLRVQHWDANVGTPIRAIIPVGLGGILIALATWTNLKGEEPAPDADPTPPAP